MQSKAVFVAVMFIGTAWPCWAGVTVEKPRCEYQVDPLGIDVAKPRLSWILHSPNAAEKQSAYQVLVASSPDMLGQAIKATCGIAAGVASDQTIHVEYAGKPLGSRMQCFWKVRAWDTSGRASAWSRPARWTMGLLSPADWGAKWIAYYNPADPPPVTPHNGYHCEMASSADVAKWVAVDLGKERTIDAVRLCPARPFDYPDTPGFLFPVRFKVEAAGRPIFRTRRWSSIRRRPTCPIRVLSAPALSFPAGRRAVRSSDA